MSSRAATRVTSALLLAVLFGCSPSEREEGSSARSAAPAALVAAGGLLISSPLSLDKSTVVAGDVLHATVTFQNTSASPISIQHMTIAGRPPGGTNIGGPYCDLFPQLGAQTIQPGATLTLAAARTFTSTDPLGSWYSYVTYQDAAGGWHDSASSSFTVAQPGFVISSPLALDKSTVVAGDVLHATVTFRNATPSPISIQRMTIAGRPPGGTNIGGPFADLQPKLGPQTIAAGATLTLAASRSFSSTDPAGSWYSYVTYQDAAGAWHDGPNVNFTVAQPAPAPQPAPGGLIISSPLSLDRSVVFAGDTLNATVTFQNTSASPISIQHVTIAGRPPGGTNIGGPFADLQPQLGAQTVAAGATMTVAASRAFTAADPLGSWYSYVTYQDAAGAWHDSPNVSFTVSQPTTVTVVPSAATTTTGGTIAFQASIAGTAAAQSAGVSWSVQEALGGTIDAAGVYAAPAAAGVYHVVATSVWDASQTDTAAVTVTVPELAIVSPLLLDKTTVVAGDTLQGTVTWQNTSSSPISIQFAVISGRRPGGSNVGGPYDDLLPKLTTAQTIQPGAVLTMTATRTFSSLDPLGLWYSYATYQDASGVWHDGPNVNFNVRQPVAVTVTPAAASIGMGGTVNFTASVTGTDPTQSTGVTWSVQEPGGGTISAAGVYTAPATSGTYHVLATSVADPSKSATATVSVASPDLVISAALSLDKTTVVAGDTLHGTVTWQNTSATPIPVQFAVISGRRPGGTNVGGPYDDLLPKMTALQTVQPGATLTLSAARTFTSADAVGSWYSYATYQDGSGVWHDGPNVNFTVKKPVAVSVTPAAASLVVGTAITLQASVTGTDPGQSTAVTWSVQEPSGGTVTAAGIYTAPQLPGTYHAVATSVADPSKTDTSTLTVTPPPSIAVTISPDPASVAPGGAMTFSASVTNLSAGQSPAVTWSVLEPSGGTITPLGVYGAPTTPGTYHVVATSVADPTKSDTAAVSVGQFTLIPAQRLTTWNPGIAGGVPARMTVCATVNASTYGNGSLDATGGIQGALDACPVGQVVQLSAGDFKVTSTLQITKGIVLRGMGPTQTRLKMPVGTSANVITVGTQWFKFTQSTNLASDAVKGSTTAVLVSNPGLKVGEIVAVDQITNPAITEWSTKSPPGDASRTWFTRPNRPVGQILEVQSVSGNTITFTTPFHIDFQTAFTAQLSRFSVVAGGPVVPVVKFGGIEDLYVSGGSGGQGNLWLENAAYSWIKNVESDFQDGPSIAIDASFRCIVRDSYVHSTQTPTPGGGGYGFSFSWYASDNLLENNISWNMNKVMVMRATGGGNVVAYNYMEDGWIDYSPGWVETGINASHMTCPHYELFEGNQSFNFDGDNTWGNAVYITVFRNHFTAKRRSIAPLALTDAQNPRAIGLMEGHKWYSFVGNVLGMANQNPFPSTSYILDASFPWNDDPIGMWRLGYNPENWSAPPDPNVMNTVIREGNFDYATNQVHWVNGPQQLPASLYLSSKPAFFGQNPWPWVDPTGTVKVATLPARARFDAMHP